MNEGLTLGEGPPRPALAWLRTLLWPTVTEVGVTRSGRSGPNDRAWWILPDTDAPRLLVPSSGAAAAVALRQFNNSMSQTARVKKVAAGQALRLARTRSRRVSRLVVRGGSADGLIGTFLPELFGRDSVEAAISIGRDLRPNLKPVLQVITRDGTVLGYVKIGWNAVTRSLLDNEARVLQAWRSSPPSTFRVPEVLHHGPWEDLVLLVVSPVPHPVLRRGRRDAMPGSQAQAEVASLGGVRHAPVAESEHARRLADRFGVLASEHPLEEPAREALNELLQPGGASVPLGTWHGDWAPWNMATTSRSLFVWDWERSADDVPVGLDAFHFAFEVAYHKGGDPPSEAVAIAVERSRRSLAEMGMDGDADRLKQVYLLERLARIEEGRSAAVRTDDRLRDWILGYLGGLT
jgi:hypothetical protein